MEHLPPVSRPYDPVYVPYIGARDYDNLDFAGYPERRGGWDVDRLLDGDLQGHTSEEAAAFLQEWLYFGLLHEVIDLKIQANDFIRIDATGKKWMNTEKLPVYLHAFEEQVEHERCSENKIELFDRRNRRIRTAFTSSRTIWQELLASDTNPLPEVVCFSIHVLAATLQVAATDICGLGRGIRYPEVVSQPGYRDVPWEKDRHWRITPSPFMDARMLAQGWCPSMIEQIRRGFNPLGQYYVSILGPPHRKLDHSRCTNESRDCESFKSFVGSHGTHLLDDCKCEVLTVDQGKLENIIRNGEIPVLYFNEETARLEVESSKHEPELEYTAISHVWIDGWGNPEENSLPSCRVKKLVQWISATYDHPDFSITSSQGRFQRLWDFHPQKASGRWQISSGIQDSDGTWQKPPKPSHAGKLYFWMDTLCVPRFPDDIHNKAVMQMRDVYSESERVLVLDSALLASTAEASYEEINMRIQCSRWIRRLWTLQEAVLPKRLLFQFKERAIITSTGSTLWDLRQSDVQTNYWNSIGWDCFTSFEHYAYLRTPAARLPYVWKELLTNRCVSVIADEPICGAIMMDFDLEYLMLAPDGEERMRRFWEMHGSIIPLGILFLPGPRLQSEGYRWAPASFLPCENSGETIEGRTTITSYSWIQNTTWRNIVDNVLRYLNLSLAPPTCLGVTFPAYETFLVGTPKAALTFDFPCKLDGRKYYVRKGQGSTNADLASLHLHTRPQNSLAVVIERPCSQQEDGTRAIDGTRAALVSIVARGRTWSVEFLRLVSVIQHGSPFHRYPREPYSDVELEEMGRDPVLAEWITVESKWYIL